MIIVRILKEEDFKMTHLSDDERTKYYLVDIETKNKPANAGLFTHGNWSNTEGILMI